MQLTWSIDDGYANPQTAASSLRFINLKPVISAGSGHQAGSTDPLPIDALLQLRDDDTTELASATVTIENRQPGDVLLWDAQAAAAANLQVAYNASTGVLAVTGVAPVETYQALLRSITYAVDWSLTSNPAATAATRQIAWQVVDANTDARCAASSEIHRSTLHLAAIATGPSGGLSATASLVEDNGAITTSSALPLQPGQPLFTSSIATLTASGRLSISDADFNQQQFSTQVSDWPGLNEANIGSLSIDSSGNWAYSLDNSHPHIQALQPGEQRIESFLVQSLDGTGRQRVEITINGRDDKLAQYASRVLDVSSQGKYAASDLYSRWFAIQALDAPN